MAGEIFISYARENYSRAEKLAARLERAGWSVWWDRKIRAGHTFDKVIQEAIDSAKVAVVLWSKISVDSDWVIAEAGEALDQGKLVPARIDDATLPLRFKRVETIDLRDWQGGPDTSELRKMLDEVGERTGHPAQSSAERGKPARPVRSRGKGSAGKAAPPDADHPAAPLTANPSEGLGAAQGIARSPQGSEPNPTAGRPEIDAQRSSALSEPVPVFNEKFTQTLGTWGRRARGWAAETFDETRKKAAILNDQLRSTAGEHSSTLIARVGEVVGDLQQRAASTPRYRRLPLLLRGHPSSVRSVAFAPDGSLVASGSDDGTVTLWTPANQRELRTLQRGSAMVLSLAFSPDGSLLAAGHAGGAIELWQVATGEPLGTLVGHSDSVTTVDFSTDGQILASASRDGTMRLWTLESRPESAVLDGDGPVYALAFSPIKDVLASGGAGKTVRIWDIATRRVLSLVGHHPSAVIAIAFLPDGRSLATVSDAIKLWSVSTGAELRRLGKSSSAIRAIAISSDGRRLASAGPGQDTIKLWQISSGRDEQTLTPRHRQAGNEFYTSIAFSRDGGTLVSGNTDKTITLWDVS